MFYLFFLCGLKWSALCETNAFLKRHNSLELGALGYIMSARLPHINVTVYLQSSRAFLHDFFFFFFFSKVRKKQSLPTSCQNIVDMAAKSLSLWCHIFFGWIQQKESWVSMFLFFFLNPLFIHEGVFCSILYSRCSHPSHLNLLSTFASAADRKKKRYCFPISRRTGQTASHALLKST